MCVNILVLPRLSNMRLCGERDSKSVRTPHEELIETDEYWPERAVYPELYR